MKKRHIVIIAAVCLIVAGSIISAAALLTGELTMSGFFVNETAETVHEITEDVESIFVENVDADIQLLPSEDGRCRVVCHETEKIKHLVKVEEGTLKITQGDMRKWYDHIGVITEERNVAVYLPEDLYVSLVVADGSTSDITVTENFCFGDVDIDTSTGTIRFYGNAANNMNISCTTGGIKVEGAAPKNANLSVSTGNISLKEMEVWETLNVTATTGDIRFENVECGDITTTASTGSVNLENVECENLTSTTTTGRIDLENVIAQQVIRLTADSGDIDLNQCDAEELYLKTNTGDVTGKLLSPKVFLAESNTGTVDVPKTITGGRCEITTDTGDIKFE